MCSLTPEMYYYECNQSIVFCMKKEEIVGCCIRECTHTNLLWYKLHTITYMIYNVINQIYGFHLHGQIQSWYNWCLAFVLLSLCLSAQSVSTYRWSSWANTHSSFINYQLCTLEPEQVICSLYLIWDNLFWLYGTQLWPTHNYRVSQKYTHMFY